MLGNFAEFCSFLLFDYYYFDSRMGYESRELVPEFKKQL